ncbi:hypothetical protein PVAG01_00242 [Phlyctema vagabunda]|uniref:Uncharacterized protein n=1 Tax=Phlyctema vagabunda TaxID=108571 RepID=A0ABR4PTN1_9HELO
MRAFAIVSILLSLISIVSAVPVQAAVSIPRNVTLHRFGSVPAMTRGSYAHRNATVHPVRLGIFRRPWKRPARNLTVTRGSHIHSNASLHPVRVEFFRMPWRRPARNMTTIRESHAHKNASLHPVRLDIFRRPWMRPAGNTTMARTRPARITLAIVRSNSSTATNTSVVEPRRDFPDWSTRPGGMAPCPGWPGRKYHNETHWAEFRLRCLCTVYGTYDPECKVPEHYGWGNGQNDSDQGQVKCLKKTWWGCAKTEKPKNPQHNN